MRHYTSASVLASAVPFLVWSTLLGPLSGCSQREVTGEDPEACGDTLDELSLVANRPWDVLFVIDNSASMRQEQDSLAANFQRFIDVFENNLPEGRPDLHIGVISTDVGAGENPHTGCSNAGDNGALQSGGSQCSGLENAFLIDRANVDGTRTQNFVGELGDAFSCIAQLGTQGCGFEQPLEAVKRALDGSQPGNNGFLREDAYLLLVFITDEDDCSAHDDAVFGLSTGAPDDPLGPLTSFRCFEFGVQCEPDDPRTPGVKGDCRPRQDSPYLQHIDRYIDFFHGLKEDPSQVLAAAIVGDRDPVEVRDDGIGGLVLAPSCSTVNGDATPPVRLAAFIDSFGDRGVMSRICDEDLSGALTEIGQRAVDVSVPCLHGDLWDADGDPQNGVQPECSVVETPRPAGSGFTVTWPLCDHPETPSNGDCYVLEERAECTDTPTGLAIRLLRDPEAGSQPRPFADLELRCVTELTPGGCLAQMQ